MTFLYLSTAILALAVRVQSWPQLFVDESDLGDSITLPVIPYAPISARSQQENLQPPVDISLLLREKEKRALPVIGQDAEDGIWTLPVLHMDKPGLVSRAVEFALENRSDVAYYARLNIGTPPQAVYAQLDTGSFELWVNPDCNTLTADSDRQLCQAIGVYNPSNSSTAETTAENKTLRYGIGQADITYVKDDISLGNGLTMEGVQFGVASKSSDQFAGILGIGHGEGVTTNYRNFIDELAEQGITNTKAFSLALGSKFEQEGVVIFGGVDTAKFTGKLASLPIIPPGKSPDGVPRYWVQMESMALTPPSGNTMEWANSSMPVFLNSGATLSLLPPKIVDTIAKDFGAPSMGANDFYDVDCSLVGMNGTVDFKFDGTTIKVPYREIIREIRSNPPRCYMGIVPNDSFTLLGDTFLRSAYVVFDLESKTIHMAPYTNCGTQRKTIKSSEDLKNLQGGCEWDGELEAVVSPSTTILPRPTASTNTTATPTVTKVEPAVPDLVDNPGAVSNTGGGAAAAGSAMKLSISWISISLGVGAMLISL